MTTNFVPANDLENALVAAVGSPACRRDFFRTLLASDLFFLTSEATAEEDPLDADTDLSFVLFEGPNGPYVPFFSSQARVQEVAQTMNHPFRVLGLAGKSAFGILSRRDGHAVLNPGFACGKQFVPAEIRRIADGDTSLDEVVNVAKSATQAPGAKTRPARPWWKFW